MRAPLTSWGFPWRLHLPRKEVQQSYRYKNLYCSTRVPLHVHIPSYPYIQSISVIPYAWICALNRCFCNCFVRVSAMLYSEATCSTTSLFRSTMSFLIHISLISMCFAFERDFHVFESSSAAELSIRSVGILDIACCICPKCVLYSLVWGAVFNA